MIQKQCKNRIPYRQSTGTIQSILTDYLLYKATNMSKSKKIKDKQIAPAINTNSIGKYAILTIIHSHISLSAWHCDHLMFNCSCVFLKSKEPKISSPEIKVSAAQSDPAFKMQGHFC